MDILTKILEQLELIFQLSKKIFDMVNQTQLKDMTDVHDDYLSMYQASVVYRFQNGRSIGGKRRISLPLLTSAQLRFLTRRPLQRK